ncbi:hypothetical protein CERSUDRAFT_111347 [Gelatoporia subvermispora B]|uniref:Argonaute-like protein n=1 Tax=Ceriporiopsis subvermispora (strain B) TaxID=914234 RepID=M2RQN2_CERS8|nr:hypothetical protein CERSUDRAFT_111347 [Gelatoporia subvermispora B]
MAPRIAPSGSQGDRGGTPARGRGGASNRPALAGRGGGANVRPAIASRGGGAITRPAITGRGGGATQPGPGRGGAIIQPNIASHVTTIGVKRTAYGTKGRRIPVFTNHFPVAIPDSVIHHYDVVINGSSEKTLPARLNIELIERLQRVVAPDVFTPKAVYDGRKNMFAARELPFGEPEVTSKEFDVTLGDPATPAQLASGRGPKVYKIRLTHVATINPEVLLRFLEGKQSQDNMVLTAITALNVVVRMDPTIKWPFNVRSFFTDMETKNIGSGIVLWRGYFQSVRPAPGRMLINVDISTGTMYQPGPLIDLCLASMGKPTPQWLTAKELPERERIKLQRFISGIRVITKSPGPQGQANRRATPRVVKKLTQAGADALSFTMREGGTMTVAQYFQKTYNQRLKFPALPCVEVGSGALIPLELCDVEPGQIMRKQVPPEKTKDVLEFATKRPSDRLESIKRGLGVLAYGESEYVREFGMRVDTANATLGLEARVLEPPTLKYGPRSKQPNITPERGAWNMIDKKFYRAAAIKQWIVVIFESDRRFRQEDADATIRGLLSACREVGIEVGEQNPMLFYRNPQADIGKVLYEAGKICFDKNKLGPGLVVAILPEGSTDTYTAIKHWGDITNGTPTQCLKATKCRGAKAQYFANVCLKINVKLGGINTIPEPRSVSMLTDPRNPTIVMGADVIHPAPGADGRPSFTAVVGNVDSDSAKYIARCSVQPSRQELIEDLFAMTHSIIASYMDYQKIMEKKSSNFAPTRIIFYRDGVSEGQFKQVLEFELPQLRRACEELKINPAITVVVVGKRHHVRFFPQRTADADKSGNCPAGTVVDHEVTHPLELDWYLQSHAGLLGTSRPAHYSVLHDENGFSPDGLQALSFALCHVYARSTRSVSIPAPVYYADIVCSRAKNHYDPMAGNLHFSDEYSQTDTLSADKQLEHFRASFKPLHDKMKRLMYFS